MTLAILDKEIANNLGQKDALTHTGAADDVTSALGYLKQLVDAGNSEGTDVADIRATLGEKTDAASTGAVNTTNTVVQYTKQLVTNSEANTTAVASVQSDTTNILTKLNVPTADASTNLQVRDVVGNKSDALVTTVGTSTSIIAYIKGLINGIFLNGYDSSGVTSSATGSIFQRLAYTRTLCGDQSATAVTTVGTTTSIMGYVKGLVDVSERSLTRTTSNLPQNTSTNIFTVTGAPIEILGIIGEVTTVIQNTTNNVKLQITDTASSTTRDICATVNIANLAVGTFFNITGTFANAMVTTAGGTAIAQATSIYCPVGAIKFSTDASITGQVRWFLRYRPIGAASVVAAA